MKHLKFKIILTSFFLIFTCSICLGQTPCYEGTLSVPAADFIPETEGIIEGIRIDPPTGTSYFYAPLMLPNGAEITKVTLEAMDIGGAVGDFMGYVKLETLRYRYSDSEILSTVQTTLSEQSGNYRKTDTSIDISVIDNSEYGYGFKLTMFKTSSNLVFFYKAIVEYKIMDCPKNVVVIPLI